MLVTSKFTKGLLAALLGSSLLSGPVLAQSAPQWPRGYVPQTRDWLQWFGAKADRANGQLFNPSVTGELLLGGVVITGGNGNPNGNLSAPAGSVFLRYDAGPGAALYVKEGGSGSSGWVAYNAGLTIGTVTGTAADAGALAAEVARAEAAESDLSTRIAAPASTPAGTTSNLTASAPLAINGNSISIATGYVPGTVASGSDPRIVGALQAGNNLSDITSATTARANLGLGTAALSPSGAFDAAGLANAEQQRAQTAEAMALQKQANLSDLTNVSAARAVLGLGSAALSAASAFDPAGAAAAGLQKSANLADLASAAVARANLGLGTAALAQASSFDPAGTAATSAAAAVSTGLPAAGLTQLYGGTTTAGQATPITLGTGLSMVGNTLNAAAAGSTAAAVGGSNGQVEVNSNGSLAGVTIGGDATLAGNGALTVSKLGGQAISLGGPLALSGAYAVTLTVTGPTSLTLPTGPGTLLTATAANAAYDPAGAAAGALQKANNLSDLPNASAARSALGLGSAATQSAATFDPAGVSATETSRAETAEAALAPLASPALIGTPTAPTASAGSSNGQIANTAFVGGAITSARVAAIPSIAISSVVCGSGAAGTVQSCGPSAYVASIAGLAGSPSAAQVIAALGLGTASSQPSSAFDPAGAASAETTRAQAAEATLAPLASPGLTGTPTAPTAAAGTVTGQIANTSFVGAAVTASRNTAIPSMSAAIPVCGTGATGMLQSCGATVYLASLAGLTGNPTAAQVDAALALGTAAYQPVSAFDAAGAANTEMTRAQSAEANLAPLASPALTGTPTGPTAAAGNSSTQLATTAFSAAAIAAGRAAAIPSVAAAAVLCGTGTAGTAQACASTAYIASLAGLTGAPTASQVNTALGLGTAAMQPATAFDAAGAASSEATRAKSAEALLAPLASPALLGTPTTPTASAGTSTTQIASTAFVAGAVTAGRNVSLPSSPPSQVYAGSGTAGTATALTQAQLTALINPFTVSLPGAVPASGGGTGNFLRADGTWAPPPTTSGNGGGSVSSVGLALPGIFAVTGSPVTSSGTLTAALSSQSANTVLAAPAGAAGVPTFRAIVPADAPTLAPQASPAFTGIPTAPTAAFGTNTQQVATTAFATTAAAVAVKQRVSATGAAITVAANATWLALVQTSATASQTITLPSNPADGEVLNISTVGDISALTLSPASGAWTSGAEMPANSGFTIGYDAGSTSWLRMH